MGTREHISQLGFTGIYRDLNFAQREEKGEASLGECAERRERGEDRSTHQGSTSTGIDGGSPEHGRKTDRRRGGACRRGGANPRDRERKGEKGLWLGLGLEAVF
jgi:hypothetical protein